MINCVIVEDEFAGQQMLAHKLKTHFPECEIVAVIDNKNQAIDFLNTNKSIDLVFRNSLIFAIVLSNCLSND